MTPQTLLTYAEAASRLRCSERTVVRLVDRGKLVRHRLDGRSFITSTSLDAYYRQAQAAAS